MRCLKFLLLALLLMAFQCEEDEINVQEDLLFDTGIFATRQLTSQSINEISELTPLPETFLEFYPNSNTRDNSGEYNLEEPMGNTIGIFIMDTNEQTITFKRDGNEIVYGYVINSTKDLLTFTFIESDAEFEQTWLKRF